MKIKANQDFLHETKRYKQGRGYEVPEGLGTYFVMSGWADSPDVTATSEAGEADLEVHDSTLGQSSEVK